MRYMCMCRQPRRCPGAEPLSLLAVAGRGNQAGRDGKMKVQMKMQIRWAVFVVVKVKVGLGLN